MHLYNYIYKTLISIFDSTLFIRFDVNVYSFLSRLTSESATFKVAMSHFVSYPCGALFNNYRILFAV